MTDQRKVPIAEADIPDWDGDDSEEIACWQCQGDGWGIVGVDWSPIELGWGPSEGEIEKCPCCHGSGLARDCTYW